MPERLKKLIHELAAGDAVIRAAAAEQIAQHASAAQAAATALVAASGDADEAVVEWSVAALEGIGAPDAADRERISKFLLSSHENPAFWAATLLGRLGEEAAPAVDALMQTLQHSPHASVRQRTVWALGEIGQAASTAGDALRAASKDGDPRLARLALDVLASLGEAP
jgi:HEAT repeat protein